MPFEAKMEAQGFAEAIKALTDTQAAINKGAAQALFLEGESVMAESKKICPVDTGALRATGHVAMPTITGNQIEVELGYGGPAVKYAVVQHERLDFKHNPGQQAKFLEVPMVRALAGFGDRVLVRINQAIDKLRPAA